MNIHEAQFLAREAFGREPRVEHAEIHPGLTDLYSLFQSKKFISEFMEAGKGNIGERVDLFNKLSEEVEANQDNPTLAQALNVWADCRDTYGLIGDKKEKRNSGVLHVFGYQAVPSKSGRFPIQSLRDFIDFSKRLEKVVADKESSDFWAEIPDKDHNKRMFFLKNDELVIAYQRADDAQPRVITMIAAENDGKKLFFRTVRNEVFSKKAIRRSNRLNGRPPIFVIGGTQHDPEADLMLPFPKKNVVYDRLGSK